MNPRDPKETTQHRRASWADMDLILGYLLSGGVLLSVMLVTTGLVWRWVNTGQLGVDYALPHMNLFEFLSADFHQVASAAFRPRLLVSLGIATLLLTPYARVLASLVLFLFVEHNWKYAVITGFVLAVLTYSLFLR